MTTATSTAWNTSTGRDRTDARFTWSGLLWTLVFPQHAHRIMPTLPGVVLVALSIGIGLAAYNSSSNILFLTLALVLSWLNLRGVAWRLQVAPAMRVGHDTIVGIELRNAKRFLPTYALAFNLVGRPHRPQSEQRAESTVTASGIDIRAALARAEEGEIRGRAVLSSRLDAGAAQTLEWVMQPTRRGMFRVELASVGSSFPFGFLRKDIGTSFSTEVVVWPASLEYRRHAPIATRRRAGEERVSRPGSGSDLLALRKYAAGDSHRLIHWKASARTRQLLVRQFAAEAAEGCTVWLRTDAGLWSRPEQFETLISFAASLAEDLFRAERLLAVAINEASPAAVRRVRDLEQFLNELAVLQPSANAAATPSRVLSKSNLLTFAPDGARGVSAFLDGQVIASV
jgi:uncharacterized protein (DUF58 family)